MFGRLLITVGAWLLGLLFMTMNGQTFTQSIILLGACVVGGAPWMSLLGRRRESRGRAVALGVVSLSAAALLAIAIDLPRAHEAQRRFNERASTTNSLHRK